MKNFLIKALTAYILLTAFILFADAHNGTDCVKPCTNNHISDDSNTALDALNKYIYDKIIRDTFFS